MRTVKLFNLIFRFTVSLIYLGSVAAQGSPRSEPTLVLTHPSQQFDKDSVARAAINRILDYFIFNDKEYYVLSDVFFHKPDERAEAQKTYYSDNLRFARIYSSNGGENEISLPKNNWAALAGGHFTKCLCQTARDLLENRPNKDSPVRFDYLTDAIYEITDLRRNNFPEAQLLSSSIQNLSKTEFREFLITDYLFNGRFCGYTKQTANFEQYKFEFEFNEKPFGPSYGTGSEIVILNFTTTERFLRQIRHN